MFIVCCLMRDGVMPLTARWLMPSHLPARCPCAARHYIRDAAFISPTLRAISFSRCRRMLCRCRRFISPTYLPRARAKTTYAMTTRDAIHFTAQHALPFTQQTRATCRTLILPRNIFAEPRRVRTCVVNIAGFTIYVASTRAHRHVLNYRCHHQLMPRAIISILAIGRCRHVIMSVTIGRLPLSRHAAIAPFAANINHHHLHAPPSLVGALSIAINVTSLVISIHLVAVMPLIILV